MMILTLKSLLLSILLTSAGLNFNYNFAAQATFVSAKSQSSASQLYDRGQQYFERQEYPSAIKTLLELLKLEPNNSKAYNTIGMSFGELKEYSAAVAAFDRAISLNNNFANAYYNRGYVYQQLSQHDLALIDFDRALKLTDGQHVSALINRGSIYALREEYRLALTDLQQAIDLDPKSATAYYNRALIQLSIGNKTAYINDLTVAEELYSQVGDSAGLAQIARIKQLY